MLKQAARGIWCDGCKNRYGRTRDGEWHEMAKSQAWITEISEGVRAKGFIKHWCFSCVREFIGSYSTPQQLWEQMAFGARLGQEFQAKVQQGELHV